MKFLNPSRNIIPYDDSLSYEDPETGDRYTPSELSPTWTVTNATLSIVADEYVDPLHYSLKFRPTNPSQPVVLALPSIIPTDNDINGFKAQFHCRVLTSLTESTVSGSAGQVACKLTNLRSGVNATNTQQITIQKSTTIYSPCIDVGIVDTTQDNIEFAVELTFSNVGGFDIFVTLPMLVNELGFTKNTFVYNMRKFIPGFIWDKDKLSEYPNYRFAKLFHALTHFGSLSASLYSKYYKHSVVEIPLNLTNNNYRFSELMDFQTVDEDYQNWMSQFNGARLSKAITTTSLTNSIQNVDTSIAWQLENAYFGRNAGTLEAIKECAQQVLSGNQIVYVFPGGSFFQINVYTLTSETPGVQNDGDVSPEVMAILEKTRPMGFVLTHEAYDTLPFILDDPEYGQLGGPGAPSAPGLG